MGESESVFSATLLSEACKLSCSVYKSRRNNRSYEKVAIDKGKTVIFAFRGSLDPNAFTSTAAKYGECQIKPQPDNLGFLDGMKDGNGQRASVHQVALTQFQDIWNRSGVQNEVNVEYEKGNTVVFTGHSIGGAIAVLATLWMLEKQRQPGPPKPVFCITFGFPLIGDEILARAVRRKKWADQFCHVVLGRDVFSRILLAPSASVPKPLVEALFPYWERAMQSAADSRGSSDTRKAEAVPGGIAEFIGTVVQHCCAVANYTSAAKMSPSNPLMGVVKPLVKLSPYRPFGHHLFCSSRGGIWIKNHFAVLPILYYALQTLGANLEDFILEHVGYGHILPNALQNMVKLDELPDLPLSEAGSIDQRTATQLEALGLGIQNCQARLSLRAAGQVLKQQKENVLKLEDEYPRKMRSPMEDLEEYRAQCLRNDSIGYYDAFKKKQRGAVDFQANLKRLELAGWWDEIILNKFEKDELPDDFQCNEEWIRRGSQYRLLVEPLDIANFYRLGKNEDAGPYFTNGRPRRYKLLQKFLEENKQLQPPPTGTDQPQMLTQDSCLWAFVEEVACLMHSNNLQDDEKSRLLIKTKCLELEGRVRPFMTDSSGLCIKELLAAESTFKMVVKWLWEPMTLEQQASSLLLYYCQAPRIDSIINNISRC